LAVFISSRTTPDLMFMTSDVIGIVAAVIELISLRGTGRTNTAVENTPSLEYIPGSTDIVKYKYCK
jgi:hypothetical protein